MLFDTTGATVEILDNKLFDEKRVSVSVLRLDKIHPVLSGNKLFKLHFFLEQALTSKHKTILTFGGAYSNHLSATAYTCASLGLKSIGIVRGEQAATLSHTLQQCVADGMQLKFILRKQFTEKDNEHFINELKQTFGDCTIVPEGGYHPLGAKGASLIMDLVKDNTYTHICTAMGTATTLAGLLIAADVKQQVIGIPVLKGMTDIEQRLHQLLPSVALAENFMLFDNYHFGGYAKKNDELIDFMNLCWQQYQLPLDFVYTAKMMYAVTEKIKQEYFPDESHILCLHTGGLQGNQSLPPGTLLF